MDENYTTATAVAQLRALANAMEALPAGVPTPTHTEWGPFVSKPAVQWLLFDDDRRAQKAQSAEIVRMIGGHWDTRETLYLFRFERDIAGVTFEVVVNCAAVCEPAVTA